MAGSTAGGSSSSSANASTAPPPAPKILLAKPGVVSTTGPVAAKFGRGDDDTTPHRSRTPAISSLNLLSDSWDFHIDRFLPFLTENTEFTVVGVIGPPGVGKSTIMNELYGFDATSPGMLLPFNVQTEDNKAMARHCTGGIEPRISAERFILLDTQPVFSPSILAEMTRPDGSSTIPVLSGESLSAELAHELMAIQVDLLKHSIPDPSSVNSLNSQNSNTGPEKENKDKACESEGYMATPVFVHTKMQDQKCSPCSFVQLKKALTWYFRSSSFMKGKFENMSKEHLASFGASSASSDELGSTPLDLYLIPLKNKDDLSRAQHESHIRALLKLRDQVLSMNCPSFARTISERDWLKNTAKIWELVKNSSIVAEYGRMLQGTGMFRR